MNTFQQSSLKLILYDEKRMFWSEKLSKEVKETRKQCFLPYTVKPKDSGLQFAYRTDSYAHTHSTDSAML